GPEGRMAARRREGPPAHRHRPPPAGRAGPLEAGRRRTPGSPRLVGGHQRQARGHPVSDMALTHRPGHPVSVEVVHDDHGGIWVITGTPTDGYHVHPVGDPIATYQRKYEARRAIRDGAIDER